MKSDADPDTGTILREPRGTTTTTAGAASGAAASTLTASEPEVVEGKTIKIHMPTKGETVKVLPGRFRVVGGLDDVPEVRFFMQRGRDTTEITFGRSSGRPYEHVQLKPRTVSTKQAKLVYDGKNYTLTNHASKASNPTSVNGRDLAETESVVLKDGDRIGMGEVEFVYSAS